MAYDPKEWHDFYVMTGGAAAALAGLLFVAMSLHSQTIMRNLFYRNRAIGTLMSLTTQLLLAASVLVPGQPVTLLGAEVEVAALFWVGMMIRALTSRGPATGSVTMSPLRRTAEIAGGLTWNALFVAAGLSLLTRVGGGFYVLALVMVFAFAWNVYVAWVLITEVSE
jgi:modulator of FtsH protease